MFTLTTANERKGGGAALAVPKGGVGNCVAFFRTFLVCPNLSVLHTWKLSTGPLDESL